MTPTFVRWALLVACVLIWGASFILMKKALAVYPPNQMAALRLVFAGAAMAPIALYRYRRRQWQAPWGRLALSSAVGSIGPAFLFALAQTKLHSGTAGVLNSLTPLFTLIIGLLLFQAKTSALRAAGVLLGLSGAVLLLSMKDHPAADSNLAYGLLIVVATMAYGFNTHFIKTRLAPHLAATDISSGVISLALVPGLLALLGTDVVARTLETPGAGQALAAAAVLGVFGTALASLLFVKLLHISDPLFATSITYFMPVVALTIGLKDGEPIGVGHLAGLGLILAGVWLVNRRLPPKSV